MADWTDVKNAREDADVARAAASDFEGRGLSADEATATLLASEALCLEIRALGVLIEKVSGE